MDETNQVSLEVKLRVFLFRHLANPSLALLMLLVASGAAGASLFLGTKWALFSIATALCAIGLFMGFIFDTSLGWFQHIFNALLALRKEQGQQ
jgi:hypothetical protein